MLDTIFYILVFFLGIGLMVLGWKRSASFWFWIAAILLVSLGFLVSDVGAKEKKIYCIGFENNQSKTEDNQILCVEKEITQRANPFIKYTLIGLGIVSIVSGIVTSFAGREI